MPTTECQYQNHCHNQHISISVAVASASPFIWPETVAIEYERHSFPETNTHMNKLKKELGVVTREMRREQLWKAADKVA